MISRSIKGLVIVLAGTTALAAVFVGGCGFVGIQTYLTSLWQGRGDQYGIAGIVGTVGMIALPIAILEIGANVVLVRSLVRRGRAHPLVLGVVAATDIVGAVAGFVWTVCFGQFEVGGLPSWMWNAAAGLLAFKGVGVAILACLRGLTAQGSQPTHSLG